VLSHATSLPVVLPTSLANALLLVSRSLSFRIDRPASTRRRNSISHASLPPSSQTCNPSTTVELATLLTETPDKLSLLITRFVPFHLVSSEPVLTFSFFASLHFSQALADSCAAQSYTNTPTGSSPLPSPTGQDTYVAPVLTGTGAGSFSSPPYLFLLPPSLPLTLLLPFSLLPSSHLRRRRNHRYHHRRP